MADLYATENNVVNLTDNDELTKEYNTGRHHPECCGQCGTRLFDLKVETEDRMAQLERELTACREILNQFAALMDQVAQSPMVAALMKQHGG